MRMYSPSSCIEMEMRVGDGIAFLGMPMIPQDLLGWRSESRCCLYSVVIGNRRYFPGTTLVVTLDDAIVLNELQRIVFIVTKLDRIILEQQSMGVIRGIIPASNREHFRGYTG